jgi:hypothetical protein
MPAASRCPHCGRESQTVSGGICADCWGVKDPKHAISAPLRQSRTEPLFDWDLDWLGIDPGLAFGAAIGALLAIIVFVVAMVRTLV